MTKVSVTDSELVIEVQGWDKIWSLTSALRIPVAHVVEVGRVNDPVEGIRTCGTYIPGVVTAGTFLGKDGLVFCDVHDPTKAIALDLCDERYSRLIIEVADPAETIDVVKRALFQNRFQHD